MDDPEDCSSSVYRLCYLCAAFRRKKIKERTRRIDLGKGDEEGHFHFDKGPFEGVLGFLFRYWYYTMKASISPVKMQAEES